MTKAEELAKMQIREKQKKDSFYEFVSKEGFIETIDKVGNFETKMPLFYKQIATNKFLAFNIPYYGKVKSASFQSDFWVITAINKNDFLKHKLLDENLKDIMLGFNLEEDIDLYKSQKA